MDIKCPHCQFNQQVADDALPPLPCKVNCPQCSQSFTIEATAASLPIIPEEELLPSTTIPSVIVVDEQPARFWVRVLAALLDSLLCNILVFVMGSTLGLLFLTNNFSTNELLQLLLMVMSILITMFYYVFFTGYCGQTPGKMALHIKVVHINGFDVGYGEAFLREITGKTLSWLLLGVGCQMVAFRRDKRGLHDLIAGTKVIKL